MAIKTIKIEDLKQGMFLAEIDISWIKSPFFRHKRLITKQEDIDLLKSAGVKECKIDLSKSELQSQKTQEVKKTRKKSQPPATSTLPADDDKGVVHDASHDGTNGGRSGVSNDSSLKHLSSETENSVVPLKREMAAALNLRKNIIDAVDNINKSVEMGNPILADEVTPIVDKTMQSLERNDQALITLLHQSREHTKLASHTFGVFTLSMLLATKLEIVEADRDELGMAALLHDAGWSKLPNNLLGKGKPYATSEKKLIQQHIPILKKVMDDSDTVPERVKLAILQHHELCDGSGYPNGLSADRLHPWAKLIAICDHYDELVHGLGEAPGLTPQKALSDLLKLAQSGKYDEDMTATLIRIMGVYPLGSAVMLSTGEKGVITEMNREDTMSPKVHLFYDANGQTKRKPLAIDLSDPECKDKKMKIEKVLCNTDAGVDPDNLLVLTPELVKASS